MNKLTSTPVNKDSQKKASENASSDPVSDALDPILNDLELPEDKKQKIKAALISVTYQRALSFSGPLPPPSILEEYSSVIQNGAERIMKMTENQSAHRISIEKQVISSQINQSSRGQWLGFIIGIVGLGLATFLAVMGHEIIAGIFGTTTIVGLTAVFVIGKRAQEKDLKEKQ